MSLAFEDRIVEAGLIGDPFFEGAPRFREEPVVLSSKTWSAACDVARGIVRAHDELTRIVGADPDLLDSFYELLPCQRLLWEASSPFWHGYARADVFETDAGLVVCELNSDTPTGHAEALCLSSLVRDPTGATFDPNERLKEAHLDMIEAYAEARLGPGYPRTAGIMYPTDLTEDLPLVRLLQGWLESRGFRVVTGSPYNLGEHPSGQVALFGEPCSVIVRHYKTDWLTERVPVWTCDPPFDDPLPLARPLELLARAELRGRSVVVNPLGAALTQNKRSLALLWEKIDLLTPESRDFVMAHVPETMRLESAHPALLSVERESWVLKSDYGCEGDEVVLGHELTQDEWDRALSLAQPGRWIVQRRFRPRLSPSGEATNLGVYVVAGEVAGLYARTHSGATDRHATSAPAWVKK